VETGRLEAFSDGVLAVAITLLVLDLHSDADARDSVGHPVPLAHQLASEWPAFGAYVVSFSIIGVIWVNHHTLIGLVGRVDRTLLFANLVLLFFVTTIPFTTATLASYLRVGGSGARVAVGLYGVSMEGMAISFTLILRHLLRHRLLRRPVSSVEGARALRRFGAGSLVYPLIAAVGLASPAAMLVCYAAITAFYIGERTSLLPDGVGNGAGDA